MLLAFMLRWPTNKRTTWALSLTRLSTKIILLSFSSTLTSRKSWRPCPRGDPPCWPPEITVGTNMMASMSMRMNILSRVTRPKELWKERGLSNISRAQQKHYELFWWAITRLPKYGEISKSVCARRIEYRCMKNIWNCNQSIKYHLCRLGQKWWQKHEKHEKCPPVAESCTHNSFALQNKPHHPPLLLLLLLHLLFHNEGSSLPTNLLLSHPHHPHLLLVHHTQLLLACLAPHVNLWRQLSVWVFKRCSPGLRCPTLCTPPSSQKSKFRSKCTPAVLLEGGILYQWWQFEYQLFWNHWGWLGNIIIVAHCHCYGT